MLIFPYSNQFTMEWQRIATILRFVWIPIVDQRTPEIHLTSVDLWDQMPWYSFVRLLQASTSSRMNLQKKKSSSRMSGNSMVWQWRCRYAQPLKRMYLFKCLFASLCVCVSLSLSIYIKYTLVTSKAMFERCDSILF